MPIVNRRDIGGKSAHILLVLEALRLPLGMDLMKGMKARARADLPLLSSWVYLRQVLVTFPTLVWAVGTSTWPRSTTRTRRMK